MPAPGLRAVQAAPRRQGQDGKLAPQTDETPALSANEDRPLQESLRIPRIESRRKVRSWFRSLQKAETTGEPPMTAKERG